MKKRTAREPCRITIVLYPRLLLTGVSLIGKKTALRRSVPRPFFRSRIHGDLFQSAAMEALVPLLNNHSRTRLTLGPRVVEFHRNPKQSTISPQKQKPTTPEKLPSNRNFQKTTRVHPKICAQRNSGAANGRKSTNKIERGNRSSPRGRCRYNRFISAESGSKVLSSRPAVPRIRAAMTPR